MAAWTRNIGVGAIMAWTITIVASVSGCSSGEAVRDAAVHGDPQVRALPVGMDWVAGADVPALLANPTLAARVTGQDVLGLTGGLHALDHVVVGCGQEGCVGLVDGDVDSVSFGVSFGAVQGPSEHLTAAAWQGRLDRLGEGKLVVGDRALVATLRRTHRDGAATFDGAWLEGRVPKGALWVATRDPRQRAGLELLARLGLDVAGLERSFGVLEGFADELDTLALGFEPVQERLTVRAVAVDTAGALRLEAALRARGVFPPRGVSGMEIRRDGTTVEAVARIDVAGVLR